MKSRNRRNSSRPWRPASRNNIKDRKKVKCLETPTTVEAFVVDLFVLKEVGRAGGQSERQGTSYSFSRLLKALRLYIRVCVCVCVDSLAFWKGPPCPVQPCGTNNVCRTSSLRSPWNLQPIPRPMSASLFFYKSKRPATTLFFISLCSRQTQDKKVAVCV